MITSNPIHCHRCGLECTKHFILIGDIVLCLQCYEELYGNPDENEHAIRVTFTW